MAVFHPKGGILRRELEGYVRQRHIDEGFSFVNTPHISKEGLFHTSGHLPYYEDGMFPPMEMEGSRYFLKAMNCPMHNLIYQSRGRSYRELPLRLFEFGSVYRNELSGVVHGLTRVRGMTQDDSHSYCTPEQAPEEIAKLLQFVLGLLRDFGLDDFYLELSTRDPLSDKFIGSDEEWEVATAVLERVATESGLELVPDPGGAAYYGPKISVQSRDAIGRTWQMSTIQYDFNQPARFGLEYQAADGTRQQPVMIHSAKFGSIERFIGVLIEHYAGAFPAWLAPVQVVGIPVADAFGDYLQDVIGQLRARGVRAEADHSDDRMQKKIRTHTTGKVPFLLLVGERDVGGRCGVLPLPGRHPAERHPGRAGGRRHRRLDPQPQQRLAHRRGIHLPGAARRCCCRRRQLRGRQVTDGPELVEQDGIGIPDHLQRLWTPHRMAYVTGRGPNRTVAPDAAKRTRRPDRDDPKACPFCRIPTLSDEDGLIVARGDHVYAVLNLYPYNPGHLMVVPFRHLPDYTDLDSPELAEFSMFTRHALRTVRTVSAPHGFNIGINAGSAAGAGIAEHLHQHLVPRWGGDSNFMPVIGQTKVLPQLLADTRRAAGAGLVTATIGTGCTPTGDRRSADDGDRRSVRSYRWTRCPR